MIPPLLSLSPGYSLFLFEPGGAQARPGAYQSAGPKKAHVGHSGAILAVGNRGVAWFWCELPASSRLSSRGPAPSVIMENDENNTAQVLTLGSCSHVPSLKGELHLTKDHQGLGFFPVVGEWLYCLGSREWWGWVCRSWWGQGWDGAEAAVGQHHGQASRTSRRRAQLLPAIFQSSTWPGAHQPRATSLVAS